MKNGKIVVAASKKTQHEKDWDFEAAWEARSSDPRRDRREKTKAKFGKLSAFECLGKAATLADKLLYLDLPNEETWWLISDGSFSGHNKNAATAWVLLSPSLQIAQARPVTVNGTFSSSLVERLSAEDGLKYALLTKKSKDAQSRVASKPFKRIRIHLLTDALSTFPTMYQRSLIDQAANMRITLKFFSVELNSRCDNPIAGVMELAHNTADKLANSARADECVYVMTPRSPESQYPIRSNACWGPLND